MGTDGVYLLQHTELEVGSVILRRVRRLVAIAVCASVALVACGSDDEPQSAAVEPAKLAGAPAPLAKLHSQANELLDGGADAFEKRLEQLRGYPVVVNKWASWCGPCRFEFPFFQKQATKRAKNVAFVGVDSNDNDGDAKDFLADYPVPFPSYKDPSLEIAAVFNAVQAFPSTAFYDSEGELAYVHQGGYATEAKLAADIERYAR
jgi:cytochrome c biogenesis protein CcmG, thiol:disulfide interchange protein DsbE